MLVINASAPMAKQCAGTNGEKPKWPPQAASTMTGIECSCAALMSAGRSDNVPKYPGSVNKSAIGFWSIIFSNSLTGIPMGTPVAASISGDNQIGSKPAKTSALKTERCAVRESATLSPGFPRANHRLICMG